MRFTILRALACFASIACVASFASTEATVPPDPDQRSIAEALKLRTEAEQAIRMGTESAGQALARLKADGNITGLQLDPDADFAYGIIDLGERLVAAAMPGTAEVFFRPAEPVLDQLIQRTPDKEAALKAQYLVKLSFLRGTYLGKYAQAMKDIDQAIALQPEDRELQRRRQVLADSTAAIGKTREGN